MDLLKLISKFFNAIFYYSGTWNRRHKSITENLLVFLKDEDKSILDFGCGGGIIMKRLGQETTILRTVYGVDTYLYENCNLDNINLTLFDGENLPFINQAFDAVYIIDVLHHLDNISHIQKCLKEIVRVAKNRVIIHDYAYETPLDLKILKITDELVNREYGIKCPMNFYKKGEWESILGELPLRGTFKKNPGDFDGRLGFWWVGT